MGVGAGGLETFWGELLGKKYYMFENIFFDQILGVQRGVKRVFKLGGMPPSLSCQLGVYSTVPALD